jgi:hypothetical protein
MQLPLRKSAGTLLFLALGFAACDKEPQYQSPQKFLTQAPWQISSDSLLTYTVAGQPPDTEDLNSNVQPCVQDNLIYFDADGNYRQEEGPQKCSDSAAQSKSLGRWSYDALKRELLLEGDGRLEWQVLQLDNTTLKIFLQSTFYNTTDTVRRAQTRVYLHPIQ